MLIIFLDAKGPISTDFVTFFRDANGSITTDFVTFFLDANGTITDFQTVFLDAKGHITVSLKRVNCKLFLLPFPYAKFTLIEKSSFLYPFSLYLFIYLVVFIGFFFLLLFQ